MGNIGPRQQRYEVLPDVLDLSRLADGTAPAPPAEPAVPSTDERIGTADPAGRDTPR